jgi:mono/diheme cytochrome c family protein
MLCKSTAQNVRTSIVNRNLTLLGLLAVAAVVAYFYMQPNPSSPQDNADAPRGEAIVKIEMPPIEGNAAIGQRTFEFACAKCHGQNAVGIDGAGPPLIHRIYEPGHHADESFQRAVALGVRSHHWSFGNMPPVEGLTRADVAMVVEYIREIQRANGIQ